MAQKYQLRQLGSLTLIAGRHTAGGVSLTMRSRIVCSGLALGLLIACGKGKQAEIPKPAVSLTVTMRAVGDEAFLLGDNANVFTDSLRTVIRDTIAFKAIWSRATSLQPSALARPAVDFSKEMVILAAAGTRKPGDVIHIDSVGTRGALTVVVVRTTLACQSFATNAYPFELARVPRNEGDVVFREHVLRAPECQ